MRADVDERRFFLAVSLLFSGVGSQFSFLILKRRLEGWRFLVLCSRSITLRAKLI